MPDYYPYPTDWKDLQKKTAKLLEECGYRTEIEKVIITTRGKVNIDVFVKNETTSPKSIYLIECKYWKRKVSKNTIHAFRSVVNDYGPNYGYIITKKGFQSGAHEATDYTNVDLLTWEQFLLLFKNNWKERMFWRIWNRFTNISYYRSGMNKVFEGKEINDLSTITFKKEKEYEELIEKSDTLFTDKYSFPDFLLSVKNEEVQFPVIWKIKDFEKNFETESQLYDEIILEQNRVLKIFDTFFGQKIRAFEKRWG